MSVTSLTYIIAKSLLIVELYDRDLPVEGLHVEKRAQGQDKQNLVTDLNSDVSSSIDDSSLHVLSVNQILGCSINRQFFSGSPVTFPDVSADGRILWSIYLLHYTNLPLPFNNCFYCISFLCVWFLPLAPKQHEKQLWTESGTYK